MALEAINEIKKAEALAEEKIKNVQQQSKDLIKNANMKAEEEFERIINEAKLEAKDILDRAIASGNEEAAPILEKGKSEKEAILNISKDIMDKAVNLVIERIVKINGNS